MPFLLPVFKGKLSVIVGAWVLVAGPLAPSCPLCLGGESSPIRAKVISVLDGDTVLLHSGQRLRYLGVDAPEIAHEGRPADCYGDAAKAFNSDLVMGKDVRIEYEKDGGRRDSHGRLTGYVFLMNGQCVNKELLHKGLAFLYSPPGSGPLRLRAEFLQCQREAVDARRGMWGACPVKEEYFYWVNKANGVFHRPQCSFVPGRVSWRWERIGSRWDCIRQGCSPCRRCKP